MLVNFFWNSTIVSNSGWQKIFMPVHHWQYYYLPSSAFIVNVKAKYIDPRCNSEASTVHLYVRRKSVKTFQNCWWSGSMIWQLAISLLLISQPDVKRTTADEAAYALTLWLWLMCRLNISIGWITTICIWYVKFDLWLSGIRAMAHNVNKWTPPKI